MLALSLLVLVLMMGKLGVENTLERCPLWQISMYLNRVANIESYRVVLFVPPVSTGPGA